MKGETGINYGTLSGLTNWVRDGYGASANLDLILELQAVGPAQSADPDVTQPDDLYNNYHFEIIMSEDTEDAISSEYFTVKHDSESNTDTVKVGNKAVAVDKLDYRVG